MLLNQQVILFYSFLKFLFRQWNYLKSQTYAHFMCYYFIIFDLKFYLINYDDQNSKKQLQWRYYQQIKCIFYHFPFHYSLQLIHCISSLAHYRLIYHFFNGKIRMLQINQHDLMFMVDQHFYFNMLDLKYLFLWLYSLVVSYGSWSHQNYFLHYLSYQQIHRFYVSYQLFQQFLLFLLDLHQFHYCFSNQLCQCRQKDFIIQLFILNHIF